MSGGRTYVLRDDGVRNRFKAFLDELPRDQLWEVTVAEFKPRHSTGQRAKWHAQISEIARATGNDPDDVKEFLKDKYGPKREVAIGGRSRLVSKPSSAYTAEEYSEMIDRTAQWAAAEFQLFV
jgi:hypothetical protein